jgi:hypothetical protein
LLFRTDIVTTFSGETVRKLRAHSLLALGILVYAVVFSGCSGTGTISITLSPDTTQTLNPGQTVTIIASLTNDVNNQGVTWSLTGPGSLSSNTTTSVVYTAPSVVAVSTTATITATSVANIDITATESVSLTSVLTITTTSLPSGLLGVPYDEFVNAAGAPAPFTWALNGTLPAGLTFLPSSTSTSAEISGTPTALGTSNFSVQVTDSADASATQALSITINKPPPLSVATGSLPNGQVNTAYTPPPLQASSGTQPYTWSLANGTLLPIGLTLTPAGLISGTPIVTGTTSFTVQVTDSSSPPQTAFGNLSITINPGSTTNSRLSGNYAFLVQGFDPNGLFVAAGSFVADGLGNISGGIIDTNDTVNPVLSQSFTGTYSIATTGLGFMTLSTSPSRIFAISLTAGGNANIIEFDDSTGGVLARDSGVLLKQDVSAFSTALTAGPYAFGFSGIDSGQNRYGLAGAFQSGGNGSFTSGALDSDDASTGPSSDVPFTGGGYTAPTSTNGRGTANIVTAQGTTGYSYYVVSATQLLVMETDTFSTKGYPLVSGQILQQTTSSFADGNLNGVGVFELSGLDGTTPQSQIGLFAGNGGGGFNLTSDENIGGALTSPGGPGSYSVAPNGRVTGWGPVLYLVTTNTGFIIGTDSAVSFGYMTPQTVTQYNAASLTGTYAGGSFAPVAPVVDNVVSITVAGSGSLQTTSDISSANGLSQVQTASTAQFGSNNGRAVVSVNGIQTYILYMISPSQFYQMVAISGNPTIRVDSFQQ